MEIDFPLSFHTESFNTCSQGEELLLEQNTDYNCQ